MNDTDYIAYPIKIMLPDLKFKPLYIIFGKNQFSHHDRCYKYEQITNLYYTYTDELIALVPNTIVYLGLRTSDGAKVLTYESGLRKRIDKVNLAYNLLQKKTFDNRANYYINQLTTNGYFDYIYGPESSMEKLSKIGMWSIKPTGTIRIYNDGFLEYKNKRYDLKVANSHGLLEFGYRRGAGLRKTETTFGILISEQGFGILDLKFAFEPYWDTDIIHHIISELADGKKF